MKTMLRKLRFTRVGVAWHVLGGRPVAYRLRLHKFPELRWDARDVLVVGLDIEPREGVVVRGNRVTNDGSTGIRVKP